MQHEESKLIVNLILEILTGTKIHAPSVPGMIDKPEIGSCSQAEEFFLEIAHGRVRRGGQVNIIVDPGCRKLMVEKMSLGESHSALVISPVLINDVFIPPGSLCALDREKESTAFSKTRHGFQMPLAAVLQARFLRLTTLAVAPRFRTRAFGPQIDMQIRLNMLSPLVTTLDDMRNFAESEFIQ